MDLKILNVINERDDVKFSYDGPKRINLIITLQHSDFLDTDQLEEKAHTIKWAIYDEFFHEDVNFDIFGDMEKGFVISCKIY